MKIPKLLAKKIYDLYCLGYDAEYDTLPKNILKQNPEIVKIAQRCYSWGFSDSVLKRPKLSFKEVFKQVNKGFQKGVKLKN